jgi:hypothetical protein
VSILYSVYKIQRIAQERRSLADQCHRRDPDKIGGYKSSQADVDYRAWNNGGSNQTCLLFRQEQMIRRGAP